MTKSENKTPLIEVRNLVKSFGKRNILDGINALFYKGDVVCVIGPSGSGKSTFLRCLNRLEDSTSGQIIFEGTDICDTQTDIDKHRQKMGMVFQQFNLFPHMTVMDNLICAPVKLQGKSKEDAKIKAAELLDKVGLADRANDYPARLFFRQHLVQGRIYEAFRLGTVALLLTPVLQRTQVVY